MSTEIDLNDALDTVVSSLLPQAIAQADATSRKPLACLSSILRPLLKARVCPDGVASKNPDNRARNWEVEMHFYDEDGDEIAETDPEVVRGLYEVGVAIREIAEDVHEEHALEEVPEFNIINMESRMVGMYPAISRGDGKAVMCIRYELADGTNFKLEAKISRT